MFERKPLEPRQGDTLAPNKLPVSDRPRQEKPRRKLLPEGLEMDLIKMLLRPIEVDWTLYYCPLRGAVTQWVSKDIPEDGGKS